MKGNRDCQDNTHDNYWGYATSDATTGEVRWEGRKFKVTSTGEEAGWHKQSNSKRGPRCIMPIARRFDATEFLICRVMGQLFMLILSLKTSTFHRWDRICLSRLHQISSHSNHTCWPVKIFEIKYWLILVLFSIRERDCIFTKRQNLRLTVEDFVVCSRIKVYVTCHQDRRVKFLAGQGAILAGHCPLTARYFEPCSAKK